LNELQRQSYLSALGIDTYMPRVVLSAGPEFVLCDLESVAETVSQQALSSPIDAVRSAVNLIEAAPSAPLLNKTMADKNESIPATGPSKIDDVLESIVGKPEVRGTKPERSAPTEALSESRLAPQDELSPNFALTVWRIESDILVIDTRDVAQALPTDRLLSNILIALGYQLPTLPKPNVLKWPMIENASSGQNSNDARDMLHAFLDAQLLLDPVKSIWLMGESAARHVLSSDFNYADYIGQVDHVPTVPSLESPVTPIVVSASLVDMLLQPSLKALTWKQVQPLVARR